MSSFIRPVLCQAELPRDKSRGVDLNHRLPAPWNEKEDIP